MIYRFNRLNEIKKPLFLIRKEVFLWGFIETRSQVRMVMNRGLGARQISISIQILFLERILKKGLIY